ncbi:hypothetical protein DLAC_05505 [Tieghemostelium lacteum]|uniref:CCAAT-binding factor domain-containing protein n=1 Tax=Tieghemostelium lacteum TaxID=361077 RepID=A0A151ZG06_TIELA|nr:hypothetical protein DLAC_05505 [Tieghemostelium lacteum]|eukprot:KYQ92912.1 hypothetical protein DLAC_05505 [Tieghemostelium lacteum]
MIGKKDSKFNKNRSYDAEVKSKLSSSKIIEPTPIEKIKNIENKVLESVENVNQILDIITICQSNLKELEIIFHGIKSLEKIFLHLLDTTSIELRNEFRDFKKSGGVIEDTTTNTTVQNNNKNSKNSKNSKNQKQQQPQQQQNSFKIYTSWLFKIYGNYFKFLLVLLNNEDPSIQVPSLNSLMVMLKKESQLISKLPKELIIESDENIQKLTLEQLYKPTLQQILQSLVMNSHFNSVLWDHFKQTYLNEYHDVHYHTIMSLKDIITDHAVSVKDQSAKDKFESKFQCAFDRFIENLFDIITTLEPFIDVPEWKFLVGYPHYDFMSSHSSLQSSKKKKVKSETLSKPTSMTLEEFKNLEAQWKLLTKIATYQKEIGKFWLLFLQCSLPSSIYKQVLLGLPEQVFPLLSDPRLLMDFYTSSFNVGGVTSILALNGIFILITKYNLEYPEFYTKLYSLFQPGVIYAKYRARFFKLSESFLSSKYIPNYIVAAFIKRSAQICLISPPQASLILIPLIYTLLQRHPTCQTLINNPVTLPTAPKEQQQQPQQITRQSVLLLNKPTSSSITSTSTSNTINNPYGKDPFLPYEVDPAKCNALKSSLWELQLLRDHYAPQVSKIMKIFDSDFKDLVDLDEFSSISYPLMYEMSFKKKSSSTPLAFNQGTDLIPKQDNLMDGWEF